MIKYVNSMVTFSEFPNEISLCINISQCPCHCPGCHSSYLAEDIGEPLGELTLHKLITENKGITCVGFMGGDIEPKSVNALAQYIKTEYNLKVGWYSGRNHLAPEIDLQYFDYVKLGPYVEERGGLDNPNTNQVMLEIDNTCGRPITKDITSYFWRKSN